MEVLDFYCSAFLYSVMASEHPIDLAASILGSQEALAKALGRTKGAVSQWKEDGRRIPAEHCPVIERLTGGRVMCEQLRPDIDWSVLRSSSQATPVAQEA